MHTDNYWLTRVQQAVRDIKTNYGRSVLSNDPRPRVNISLLAYQLGLTETAALYPILRELEANGYLLQMDDDYVTFSGALMSQALA